MVLHVLESSSHDLEIRVHVLENDPLVPERPLTFKTIKKHALRETKNVFFAMTPTGFEPVLPP